MRDNLLTKLKNNLWVILLDIIAVNAAFILALLLRYYVHQTFYSSAKQFLGVYIRFAPFYTLICLLVFFVCGLYNGMWQHAGINDMNQIILANVATAAVNVLGTQLIFGDMPKSYYIVGGLLQCVMIAAIRFSYRAFQGMRDRNEKRRSWTIPAVVVGTGDCAREFVRHLEENTIFEVVMIAGKNSGNTLNGVPVVDIKSIPMWVQYHDIKAVFLADETLSKQEKDEIREAAKGAEVRDYIDYLSEAANVIPLNNLLEIAEGPLTVVLDGAERHYASADECLVALSNGKGYEVMRVSGAKIELKKK